MRHAGTRQTDSTFAAPVVAIVSNFLCATEWLEIFLPFLRLGVLQSDWGGVSCAGNRKFLPDIAGRITGFTIR